MTRLDRPNALSSSHFFHLLLTAHVVQIILGHKLMFYKQILCMYTFLYRVSITLLVNDRNVNTYHIIWRASASSLTNDYFLLT